MRILNIMFLDFTVTEKRVLAQHVYIMADLQVLNQSYNKNVNRKVYNPYNLGDKINVGQRLDVII
jgi:hypothetical protein